LAVDENGGVWTVLFDYDKIFYPTICNLIRWENGEAVESIPVADTGSMQFERLFILPDGRFIFTYYNEGGALAIAEQTETGEFTISYPVFYYTNLFPDPDGILHLYGIFEESKFIIHISGTGTTGFRFRIVGIAPGKGITSQSPMGIDSSGNFYFSALLDNNYFYLFESNGVWSTYEKWLERECDDFCQSIAAGVDADNRPYTVVSRCERNKIDVSCFLRREPDGVRAEYINGIDVQNRPIFVDQTSSSGNTIAAVAVLWATDDTQPLWLYVRREKN
jgi:hypothetical protein